MKKCEICGSETAKNRKVCIGCSSLKDVGAKGSKASDSKKDIAVKMLEEKPDLVNAISWTSFTKKNVQL